MIFQILIKTGDPCGNEESYHYKYVRASSLEDAQRIYPHTGLFVNFKVVPLEVVSPPSSPRTHDDLLAAMVEIGIRQ